MPATAPDRDDGLADDLLRAVGRLNRWASHHAELAVPPGRLRLLALLDELGPTRVGDLARADSISQPTMTVQVDRLECAGLVTRGADPEDSRAVLVRATPAGRRALQAARRARGAALAPLVDALAPQDRAALHEATAVLEKLVAGLSHTP